MQVITCHRAIVFSWNKLFCLCSMLYASVLTDLTLKSHGLTASREISITHRNCHQPNQTRRDTLITSAIIVSYGHDVQHLWGSAWFREKKKTFRGGIEPSILVATVSLGCKKATMRTGWRHYSCFIMAMHFHSGQCEPCLTCDNFFPTMEALIPPLSPLSTCNSVQKNMGVAVQTTSHQNEKPNERENWSLPRGDGASMIEGYFLAGRSQASNFANISSIFDDDLYSVRYQQQALTVGSGRGPLSGSLLD